MPLRRDREFTSLHPLNSHSRCGVSGFVFMQCGIAKRSGWIEAIFSFGSTIAAGEAA